jgi:hypothetical protein
MVGMTVRLRGDGLFTVAAPLEAACTFVAGGDTGNQPATPSQLSSSTPTPPCDTAITPLERLVERLENANSSEFDAALFCIASALSTPTSATEAARAWPFVGRIAVAASGRCLPEAIPATRAVAQSLAQVEALVRSAVPAPTVALWDLVRSCVVPQMRQVGLTTSTPPDAFDAGAPANWLQEYLTRTSSWLLSASDTGALPSACSVGSGLAPDRLGGRTRDVSSAVHVVHRGGCVIAAPLAERDGKRAHAFVSRQRRGAAARCGVLPGRMDDGLIRGRVGDSAHRARRQQLVRRCGGRHRCAASRQHDQCERRR